MAITSTSEPPVSAIDHNFNKSKAMAWLETEVVDYDMLICGGIARCSHDIGLCSLSNSNFVNYQ